MPVNDPTPPLDRLRWPRHDALDWRDVEHLNPRPRWQGRKPGDDTAGAPVRPAGPGPAPLAGAARTED